MDEKIQEETPGKETESSPAETKTPGTVDTQNRPAPKDEADKESPDLISQANFAAERMKEASEEMKKQNDRAEKLQANSIASGKGQMVQSPNPMSEEEKASRRRIKAIGDASGSSWAKDYE